MKSCKSAYGTERMIGLCPTPDIKPPIADVCFVRVRADGRGRSHSRLQTKMHELSRRPSALTAISATTARYVVVLHSFVSRIICRRRHITNVWVCTHFFKAPPSYGPVKHDTVVALQQVRRTSRSLPRDDHYLNFGLLFHT